ncbi:MAG: DegT/DnrJ/EryC1/StrS family aminotransferase, partial [Actinomycetes bacterium]
MIPVYKPRVGQTERDYVADAVESTWISSKGAYLDRFEAEFPKFVEADYGVATCNGTVSLHVAFEALGLTAGDEVIVPTFTYVASVNAITYTGATPVFVDSEAEFWNMDPALIEAAITPRTKAIEVVHLYGHPSDMDPILEIAQRHGLAVIEDAAEAHGATYRGRKVGSIGTAGSFSFFGNKIITTGEGGMVVTNDAEFADKCRHLRGQGVSPTETYWHDVVGFNYRMTNIAAAIGCAQLEQVDEVLAKKAQIAGWYTERLEGIPGITLQREAEWAHAVWWMNSVLVHPAWRDELMTAMRAKGVDSRPFFHPAHSLPMYQAERSFPVAEYLGAAGINLPSYPDLTEEDVDTVCTV